MPTWYYRYISYPAEVTQVQDERKVLSTNPTNGHLTWYAPERYHIPRDAERALALPSAPTHRMGALPDAMMPSFAIPHRVVNPRYGHPGGGIEVATRHPVWLSGLWDYSRWLL